MESEKDNLICIKTITRHPPRAPRNARKLYRSVLCAKEGRTPDNDLRLKAIPHSQINCVPLNSLLVLFSTSGFAELWRRDFQCGAREEICFTPDWGPKKCATCVCVRGRQQIHRHNWCEHSINHHHSFPEELSKVFSNDIVNLVGDMLWNVVRAEWGILKAI